MSAHHVSRRVALIGVVIAVAGSLIGLVGGTGAGAASAKTIPPPAGLPAFYSVPQPLPTTIGKLVKSQLVAAPGVHGSLYGVMYVSKSVRNHPVAVTGIVAIPNGAPPAGGFPVVTWGHGTNGMA